MTALARWLFRVIKVSPTLIEKMDEGTFKQVEKRHVRITASVVVTIVIALVAAIVNEIRVLWQGGLISNYPGDFFESVRQGTAVKQWWNSWSSFAFTLAGVYTWLRIEVKIVKLRNRHVDRLEVSNFNETLKLNRAFGFIYCFALNALGAGSFWFHANLTVLGGFMDYFGMYALASALVGYTLCFALRWKWQTYTRIFLITWLALAILHRISPGVYAREIFKYMIISSYVIAMWEVLRHKRHRLKKLCYLGSSLVSLALAKLVWNLDVRGEFFTDPTSPWQGHPLWHILCAVAASVVVSLFFVDLAPHLNAKKNKAKVFSSSAL
jgi:hypothetical protein